MNSVFRISDALSHGVFCMVGCALGIGILWLYTGKPLFRTLLSFYFTVALVEFLFLLTLRALPRFDLRWPKAIRFAVLVVVVTSLAGTLLALLLK